MAQCVLVADDSRPFAEMVRATLEDAGYEVVTAYSGLAAVAAGEKHDVSAAVLDVLMPGMSGDLVAHRLRQTHPSMSTAGRQERPKIRQIPTEANGTSGLQGSL